MSKFYNSQYNNTKSITKVNQKLKKTIDRYNKNETVIINYIDFLRKYLLEKDKQRNFFNYWKNKFDEFSGGENDHHSEKKNIFEKTYEEIANIQKDFQKEFHIKENKTLDENKTPGQEEDTTYLHEFIKSAKYEIISVSNKKNEKSEALEKKKIAGEIIKNLDKKIKNFIEVLRQSIFFILIDKKIVIDENITQLCLKLKQDLSLIELKISGFEGEKLNIENYVNNSLNNNNNNKNDLEINNNINNNFNIDRNKKKNFSLKKIVKRKSNFFNEIINKFNNLKTLNNHDNKIKFSLDKMSHETQCRDINSNEFNFFISDADTQIINSFIIFLNLFNDNNYLMDVILNVSDIFYERKLLKVSKNKLKKFDDFDLKNLNDKYNFNNKLEKYIRNYRKDKFGNDFNTDD